MGELEDVTYAKECLNVLLNHEQYSKDDTKSILNLHQMYNAVGLTPLGKAILTMSSKSKVPQFVAKYLMEKGASVSNCLAQHIKSTILHQVSLLHVPPYLICSVNCLIR
eukprot:TRINITY_DN849_c3_g1_i1.p1 TRINITY_DN849_c3_g1~~TRINITY_DN849_c3_g1_i1.p1  ORF type:complete len:109 (-),score=2.39 TRINITY_DN849_c3_g1_i1:388-714(-)